MGELRPSPLPSPCQGEGVPSPPIARRVLLVGWDAADWTFIRPLLARGLMPSLKKLMDGGAWGNLASLQPMLSPILWNSIATGKRPSKHGIHGFTELAPDGGSVRPVSSTSRRCKAIWNILSQSDFRSLVVGWYASHPAEPIKGVCVSNRFEQPVDSFDKPWPMVAGAIHPKSLEEELAPMRVHPGEIQPDAIAQFIEPLRAMSDWAHAARIPKLRSLIAQCASIHAVATHLLTTQSWDFAAVYHEGIDRFGHEFMHCHPPKLPDVPQEEFDLYKDVMTGCYAFHDMMLGALLKCAGEDTTVILVSDHGYAHDEHRPRDIDRAGPTDWHRPMGIACCAGPGFKKNDRLYGASLLDITPTILTLFRLPHALDMDGRPWVEIFDPPIEPQQIASWELIDGDCGMHASDERHDPIAAAESLKQLTDLGYIEPLSGDLSKSIQQTIDGNGMNLAISHMDARQPQHAEPIFRELLAKHPDDRDVRLQLALCLIAQNKSTEARALATSLAAEHPPIARAYVLLGVLELSDDQLDAAMKHLAAAESIDPETPGLQARLGAVYLKARQFDRALGAFERVVAADNSSAIGFDGLAQSLLGLHQYDAAVDAALEAVSLAHHLPRAHVHLAQALAAIGKTDDAIAAASLAARQAPGYTDAHRLLVDLYEHRGDMKRAAEHQLIVAQARR